ncbi:hypothetical protein Moror_17289 [Moniliophthora roreri MCA 2997]|uniref:MARVEL domain-containing protein n=1 Tax=Moniliophthora roreri (strain MCA 2997) TaxID=1381753 RepID=V2XZA7_MONRO|nr:hypothetical protein Moror_17289 [Moniliophthora roreri MCA 2997]KAI3602638.1 hypothetical protein WG66_009277 [Moniliophthora roreri]
MFSSIPIPAPLLTFISITSLFSVIVFALALLNSSVEVAWASGIAVFSTLLYHIVFLFLTLRKRSDDSSTRLGYYSTAGVVFVFILLSAWAIAFVLSCQTISNGPARIKPDDALNNARGWRSSIQVAACIIDGIQCVAVLAMTVHIVSGRKRCYLTERQEHDERKYAEE